MGDNNKVEEFVRPQTKEERKAALAARKDARKERKSAASGSATPSSSAADLAALSLDGAPVNECDKSLIHRTVTGVLTSRPTSRDIKIDSFSMGLNGVQLIQDCSIELTIGRRCVARARMRASHVARAQRASRRACDGACCARTSGTRDARSAASARPVRVTCILRP